MFTREAIYYNFFHKDKGYTTQARKIRKLYPWAKTVLEVGSGTGNMTRPLAKQGFKVTCVEPSKEMLQCFKGLGRDIVVSKIEDLKINKKFDLVLALYDVLNYVPFVDYPRVLKKLHRLSKNVLIEIWPKQPIKLFTYKRYKNYHRIRIAIAFKKIIRIAYIYWGMGIVIDFHKLYLHKQ